MSYAVSNDTPMYPFYRSTPPAGSSDNQCSETYRGPSPMSESEIWNIDAFMNPIAHNFRLAYTLHSYGQFTVYPWGYTTDYDVVDAADYVSFISDVAYIRCTFLKRSVLKSTQY